MEKGATGAPASGAARVMDPRPSDSIVKRVNADMSASGSTGRAEPPSPPLPRKRPRLSAADEAALEKLSGPRRRILEHKLVRLKHLKERYVEHGTELFFLQAGGNILDYAAWRKRPPAPQLLAFLQTRPLHPADDSDELARLLTSASTAAASTAAPEVKLSGAGATPVAVSTTLPAAVAQLTNQGWQTGRPAGGRHGMVFAPLPRPSPSTAPKFPGGTPLILDNASAEKVNPALFNNSTAGANTQEQIVEKAKQEAYVVRRATELQREGLWAEKRLPRVMEPPRVKAHWDYLLEEMVWLAADFAQERKWKKAAAKKCARMVQKHFQDKASAAQRAEKAQELQLRRVAAFAAREIRTFWSNVEKLVEFKRSSRLEERRKLELDRQLSFIVDQTERYSKQLAAGIAGASRRVPRAPASDDEFRPGGSSGSEDDEETIEAAEREAAATRDDTRAEVEALKRESHLDLDQIMKDLPPGYLEGRPPPSPPSSADYSADEDSADDEDTITEQERREDPRDTSREVDALKAEGEMSIEELMKRYVGAPSPPTTPTTRSTRSSSPSESDAESGSGSETGSESLGALVEAGESQGEGAEEERVQRAAELAAALQPTGNTLSETAVATPVPRLLRHSLREYQHVGLHWLATMRARRLNGILADEMGLGKTIQTIALLAHEALERCDWGPHLVVVPTSVMLNWEMEFKKWCPAFKILTYYGTIKERKLKRVGWTKPNAFHVCITSYKLVIQDHQSFRRKRWKYLILDEAQNIKNFKSQRWQLLLNFQTEQRLLLTGTPLQNNLMELWSLMHFLMPDVFASHTEFKEWFSPVAGMIDGTASFNQHIIQRLHKVLRPFLLRRLKSEVEKQMPKKYEHVLMCRLSKRQRFLYDDFMSRAKTRESLASGNLLSVINVLMQLRKVCNHPNLFETRPVVSPLQMEGLRRRVPAALLLDPDAAPAAVAAAFTGCLALLEVQSVGAFVSHRARHLAPPRRLVEELSSEPAPAAPAPPAAAVRLHLRLVPRPPPAANPPHAQHLLRRVPPASSHHQHQHQQAAPTASATASTAQHNTDFPQTTLENRLTCRRRDNLRRLALNNERRCWRLPLYGGDLRAAVRVPAPPLLAHDAPTVRSRLRDMHQLIDRFTVYISGAVGPGARLEVGCGCGARAARAERADAELADALRPALRLLHPVASRLATAFPHPRLIQYDCGKLQTLDALLRRLKCGGHRVLVFTQMTKMLDVLEAFLNYHGHTYLRLDGATRVDARQMLVDRFNADRRVFAFILSTRSGGVGLNLTGADTVVFYDSDWNPTMDAQAQDRCHRIGQTRDVHVYRLVCERTVEENILRKAGQKRALGDVAIESGNFTTNYLRAVSIQELLGPTAAGASGAAGASQSSGPAAEAAPAEVESALAACEDEADAAAARTAGAEAAAELAEFDENIPLEEEPSRDAAPSAAAQQHNAEIMQLEQQLTPIEKYAMRVVESSDAASEAERAAAEEMERQLREWESARRAIREAEQPSSPPPAPPRASSPPSDDDDITFSRADAHNHVWISDNTMERMPMWCPPTPPQGENDVYMDMCVDSLYHRAAMTEAQLPGVNVRRSPRPPRSPRPARRVAHPHAPHHAHHAPRSLFERPAQLPRARPRVRVFPQHDGDRAPDWTPAEDASLATAVRAQGLPADFSLAAPALLPNWDFAADVVAESARAYRSPRQCRDRYETAPPRDDAERRKQKKGRRTPPLHRAGRARGADDDAIVPRLTFARFDAMRLALERKTAAPKRRYDDPTTKNPRHAAALAEYGVDYEAALTPMEVATRRAERIAKEKSKTAGASGAAAPGPAPAAASPAPRPASAAPGPVAAPAALSTAPAPTQPQRIVVAAHPVSTVVAKGVSGAVAGVSGVSPAQLQLFRHQAFARQQLKILQQQQSPVQSGSGGTVTVAGRTPADADAHAALLKRQAAQKAAAAAAAAATGGATPAVKMACASQIRQLQLQQQLLAQRKAAAAAAAAGVGGAVRGARVLARPSAPQQVVVAHLTPHPHPGPAPPTDHPHTQ